MEKDNLITISNDDGTKAVKEDRSSQKRLYIEHLIVGLHHHAFLLFCISAGFVFSEIGSWLNTYPWVLRETLLIILSRIVLNA